jgi:hypothetical protein
VFGLVHSRDPGVVSTYAIVIGLEIGLRRCLYRDETLPPSVPLRELRAQPVEEFARGAAGRPRGRRARPHLPPRGQPLRPGRGRGLPAAAGRRPERARHRGHLGPALRSRPRTPELPVAPAARERRAQRHRRQGQQSAPPRRGPRTRRLRQGPPLLCRADSRTSAHQVSAPRPYPTLQVPALRYLSTRGRVSQLAA